MPNKTTTKQTKSAQLNYIKQQEKQKQYCYKPYRTLQNY